MVPGVAAHTRYGLWGLRNDRPLANSLLRRTGGVICREKSTLSANDEHVLMQRVQRRCTMSAFQDVDEARTCLRTPGERGCVHDYSFRTPPFVQRDRLMRIFVRDLLLHFVSMVISILAIFVQE
jgi:hypothetical protein